MRPARASGQSRVSNWRRGYRPLYSSPVSEAQFQLLRGAGFVAAVALAVLLQRLRPHARLRGSWQVNGTLWFANLIVIGLVCGACACTVARWAAGARFGVLNAMAVPRWFAVATTLVTLSLEQMRRARRTPAAVAEPQAGAQVPSSTAGPESEQGEILASHRYAAGHDIHQADRR